MVIFVVIYFKIPFCCFNDIYKIENNAEKIISAIEGANYIENKVLKGRKWKINFKLTLRNAMNTL